MSKTVDCLGCINLSEIDGRLICLEQRSPWHGVPIHGAGPSCGLKTVADKIYGGQTNP